MSPRHPEDSMSRTPVSHTYRLLFAGITVLSMIDTHYAHHSFSIFDPAKTVTLSGTVTSFEWTNPHAYIEMDVPADGRGGAARHWSVEMGSPSILQQSGWKFKDLKFGDKVTVSLSPLRDGNPGGLLIQATLPDGRVLGNGPNRGPAAPTAPTTPAAPAVR